MWQLDVMAFQCDCRLRDDFLQGSEGAPDENIYADLGVRDGFRQGPTSIAWCHRLNGAPQKNARVFDYCGAMTHAYYVAQQYPAIPMIEQLIKCASNYKKIPTPTLIAHNGTEYDHFHLFKDLAQFEKTTDYEVKYNKIRNEGVKTRYAEITFIYNSSRVVVLRLVDSFKFITSALAKFPHRFNLP